MLCERLGMTIQEAQERMSSSEFTLWKLWLMEEPSRFHREDHNFAMIAAEVRRVLAKKPNRVKLEHFLPKYESPRQRKNRKKEEFSVYEEKAMWAGMLGATPPDEWLNPPQDDVESVEENEEENEEGFL
tara:strand:- start:18178 stop:18564 length:387 start_codon:yes stop_codon:yes gene_type:complete